MEKARKKIPSSQDAPPSVLRIYKLINERRNMTELEWAQLFGISSFKTSTAKWRYVETVLRVLDRIGSDDDLYQVCPKCKTRNPYDIDRKGWTDKEIENDNHPCEGCGVPLFSS